MTTHLDIVMRAFGFESAVDAEVAFAVADRERLEGKRCPTAAQPNPVLAARIEAVKGPGPCLAPKATAKEQAEFAQDRALAEERHQRRVQASRAGRQKVLDRQRAAREAGVSA